MPHAMKNIGTPSPAMAHAFARIARECNSHVLFKIRLRRVLRGAVSHRELVARYGARARNMSLTEAVRVAHTLYRAERASFNPSRLTLDVLWELSVMLRFMAAKRMHGEFPDIVSKLKE
jgi:hypothetical protein